TNWGACRRSGPRSTPCPPPMTACWRAPAPRSRPSSRSPTEAEGSARMDSLSDDASPLYEKVKDFVLGNIGSGKWRHNSRLPSEYELVAALGVSRMTVHRALRELTFEGHLRRLQGVGTFVAPPKPQSTLIEISNIATEIKARNGRHRAEVVTLERIGEASPELLLAFEFGTRKPVDHSVVVHYENDVPVQLEERWVN